MTYLVNDKCIKCKLMDCVEVCPVDCFYEGKNMLVIKPDECIDCGVCEPECPVDAIVPDTEIGNEKMARDKQKYSEIWPNISQKKDPPLDNEKYKNEKINLKSILKKTFKKKKKAPIKKKNITKKKTKLLKAKKNSNKKISTIKIKSKK